MIMSKQEFRCMFDILLAVRDKTQFERLKTMLEYSVVNTECGENYMGEEILKDIDLNYSRIFSE